MRMFVALVPPEKVIDDLRAFLQSRSRLDDNLRWTARSQWHLTLSFLPKVTPAQLDDLCARLDRAAKRRKPIALRLAGGVAFPRPARARVLAVGVETSSSEELRRLATATHAAATRSGADVDSGRFHPHLTLARLRQPADAGVWTRTLDGYRGPGWRVGEIVLVESHLGHGERRRPRYEVTKTSTLG